MFENIRINMIDLFCEKSLFTLFTVNYSPKKRKQLLEAFCKNRCFQTFSKFRSKAPVLESPFNKVAGPSAYFEEHLQTTASKKKAP